MSTNSKDTFIVVSPDSLVAEGTVPEKEGTIARVQFELLHDAPYALTSDDVLFQTYAIRKNIPRTEWPHARNEFFSKPQACLRCSPLAKQFGWGIHHDHNEKVAIVGVGTDAYNKFTKKPGVKVVSAMRRSRSK
jgi:hypothetical protein